MKWKYCVLEGQRIWNKTDPRTTLGPSKLGHCIGSPVLFIWSHGWFSWLIFFVTTALNISIVSWMPCNPTLCHCLQFTNHVCPNIHYCLQNINYYSIICKIIGNVKLNFPLGDSMKRQFILYFLNKIMTSFDLFMLVTLKSSVAGFWKGNVEQLSHYKLQTL